MCSTSLYTLLHNEKFSGKLRVLKGRGWCRDRLLKEVKYRKESVYLLAMLSPPLLIKLAHSVAWLRHKGKTAKIVS